MILKRQTMTQRPEKKNITFNLKKNVRRDVLRFTKRFASTYLFTVQRGACCDVGSQNEMSSRFFICF